MSNELRASALRILRDRLDTIHSDRPRLEPNLLRKLPAERLLELLIFRGRYDPAADESALAITDPAGSSQPCEIVISCSTEDWRRLRSKR